MARAVWVTEDETTLGGGETIALATTYQSKKVFTSMSIRWTGGAAPTTSENLVITLDRSATGGGAYNEVIFDQDAAAFGGGLINFRYEEDPVYLDVTDQITVAYANTDDLAIECSVTMVPR